MAGGFNSGPSTPRKDCSSTKVVPGQVDGNLGKALDSDDPIKDFEKSIYSLFSAFHLKDGIVNFLKSLHEDKDIEINDDKIVYHFEKLCVNFPLETNGELILDKISYNFPEDFNDDQKRDILSRFYIYTLDRYHRAQYTVGEETISLSALMWN